MSAPQKELILKLCKKDGLNSKQIFKKMNAQYELDNRGNEPVFRAPIVTKKLILNIIRDAFPRWIKEDHVNLAAKVLERNFFYRVWIP